MTTATALAIALLLTGVLLAWAGYRVIRWLFPDDGGARN